MSSTAAADESNEWLASDEGLEERSIAKTCKRLREEAAGFDEQAAALKEQAERLLDEARYLSGQSERLRENADCHDEYRPDRLRKKRKFDALCRDLRRNDSALTDLPNKYPNEYPIAHARALGNALQGNTHVSSANICLESLIPFVDKDSAVWSDTITTFVQPLVQYVATSKSLRNVSVYYPHDDWEVNDVLQDLIIGACFQNRNIEEVTATLDRLPASAFERCQSSMALTSLAVSLNENTNEPYPAQELQMVTDAFQHFQSLTSLHVETSFSSLHEAVLSAAQKAGCPLNDLALDSLGRLTTTMSLALAEILHSSKEFKHLRLGFCCFDFHGMTGLAHALKRPNISTALTSLSELTFCECSFDKDAIRLLRAFMHTRVQTGYSSALKELTLDYSNGQHGCDLPAKDLVAMLSE